MTWRSFILGSIGMLLLVLVVAIGFVNWLVRTEGGTRWLFAQLEQRIGDTVSIQAIEGSLSTGLIATGIHVETEAFALDIDRVRATVRLRPLLDRRLELPEVAVGLVTFRQLLTSDPQAEISPPEIDLNLPVTIDIAATSVQGVQVLTPNTEINVQASSFAASLDSDRLAIRNLRTAVNDVSLEADLDIEFVPELVANGDFSWSTDFDGVEWTGSGNAAASFSAIAFEHLIQSPFTVRADGQLSFGGAPMAEVSLEWENLFWPGQEQYRSPNGRADISGWLDAIDAESAARVIIEGIEFETDFSGTVTRESVAIERLVVASDYGNGVVNGTVGLSPVSWEVDVSAVDVDPSGLIENWPGAVSIDGRLQGRLDPELQWSLTDAEISGTLLDLPVFATGGIAGPRPGSWLLDDLDITWAGNTAFADGSIDEAFDLSVRVDAPRLGALTSIADGQLLVDGTVSGSLQSPSFDGSAVGQSLRIGSASIEHVEMNGTISGIEGSLIDIAFNARNIEAGRLLASDISGSITGIAESHEIEMQIDSAIGQALVHATGSWLDDNWTGEFDQLSFDQMRFGLWELEEPTVVSLSRDSLSVERGCLQQATTRLCLDAAVGGDDQRLQLALESLELSALQFLLGERIGIAGTYDLEIGLTGPFDRPTGTLAVTGASTLISVSDIEAPLDIPIDRVAVNATLSEQQFTFSGGILAAADAGVDFDGTVNDIYADDPAITLQIDGRWADLGFISLLSPDIGRVSGSATLAVAVGGTFDNPQVSGEARWIDGEVGIPQWGLLVDDVDLLVSTPDQRSLQYAMTGVAGEGRLELQGMTELDPAAMWPTTLTVRGNNFAAVQLPEAEIIVSPNLNVDATWPLVEVTGVVAIPFARLSSSQLPSQSISTSPDVIVHGRDAALVERPLDVQADIRLVLGSDVRFAGSGLDATLTGALGLAYRSGESSEATGTVIVGGEYSTLGQTLELEQGRLIFSGPIADPIINVRAVKRYEGVSGPVVVGVLVSGTVNQPSTRLYSEPSMSDGDIVSYLVVGRPLSDSSRENSEALQAAAVSMGLTQALPQIQHFGEAIGLDELGVRASNANTGELMAGKQLSPRMYMRYTYGLMNRVGGLLLRFQLSDRLSLETRTGEHKAMDLLYMVERE